MAERDPLGLAAADAGGLWLAVAAMAFVATLAAAGLGAGQVAARALLAPEGGRHRMVLVDGDEAAVGAAVAALRGTPGVVAAEPMAAAARAALLRPWLGEATDGWGGLRLPAVVDVRLDGGDAGSDTAAVARALAAVTGASMADEGGSLGRLARAVAVAGALAVAALAAMVLALALLVMVATRAALARRRAALEVAHGLGAEDRWIAARLARRAAARAGAGALAGVACALPPLAALAWLVPPLLGAPPADPASLVAAVPAAVWGAVAAIPLGAALAGWAVAGWTAHRWLGRLA